jgi:hypothetical protein
MGDRWSSAWGFTLAALLLGAAIQLNFGTLSNGGILLLTLALVACTFAVIGPKWNAIREPNVTFALRVAIGIQVGLLLIWPPGAATALQDSATLLPFRIAIAAAGIIGLSAVLFPARAGWRLTAAIAIYVLAGAWVVALSPNPPNDVWYVHQTAGHALLAGKDPYAIQMPNIYGPGSGYYAPSLERGAVLDFGFPYPPLSLLLALPGIAVGDVRYALLLASAMSAAIVARIRPGPLATGAGLLLLFTPRTFFIVEQSWTEPIIVMLLALTVLLASRALRVTPVGLGLLLALKQHLVLTLPLALLMAPRPVAWRRLVRPTGVAVAVCLLVTLPFAIWDMSAFWHSVVEVQFLQPSRPDALAYPAWFGMPQVAAIAGFVALVPALALVIWRSARTPAGYAGAIALVYLAFFAFNKQAFANYYYMVVGALCIAVAATRIEPRAGGMTAVDTGQLEMNEAERRADRSNAVVAMSLPIKAKANKSVGA